MRSLSLLLFCCFLACNCRAYSGDFKLQIREIITASVALNEAGELVAEKGYELAVVDVEKDKADKGTEKIVWLVVTTQGKKSYLSYSTAEKESPKLLLTEKPEENSRWLKREAIPYERLRRDSPAWGSPRFLAANGPFANRILAAGNDHKLVLLKPEEIGDEFRAVGRAIHYDNLNDGK